MKVSAESPGTFVSSVQKLKGDVDLNTASFQRIGQPKARYHQSQRPRDVCPI